MTALRPLVAVLILAMPLAGSGCRNAGCQDGDVPPVPPARSATTTDGGGLLKTGAIQLGPGVGQNWYRWMGDGQWGFQ
jgi:hypothetical protein